MAKVHYLLVPYEAFMSDTYLNGRVLWRPKYKGEIGYKSSTEASMPNKEFALIRVEIGRGIDEKQLDQLLAKPDVEEIHATDDQIQSGKMSRVRAFTKVMQLSRSDTGNSLIQSIKSSVLNLQRTEIRPQIVVRRRGQ